LAAARLAFTRAAAARSSISLVISIDPYRAGQPDTNGYGMPNASASSLVRAFAFTPLCARYFDRVNFSCIRGLFISAPFIGTV
jgi:hypothetical protein